MRYPELQGKVAIVTGAASGMGRCFSRMLAAEGVKVVITDINAGELENVAAGIQAEGGEATPIKVDVRDYAEVENAVRFTVEKCGRVDILLNVAGGAAARMLNRPASNDFRVMDLDVLDWGLDVNLKGPMYFCRAVIGTMMDQHSGVIVNMGSVAGVAGSRVSVEYSAAKGGVISMSKSLGQYAAPFGVRVNCVSPGPVNTRPGMDRLKNFVGRAAEPEEIGDLVLFLCSDHSKFIVGQNYVIDGGRIASM